VFGHHNLLNLQGAHIVCQQLGVTDKEFYSAIQTFTGAAKRLELVGRSEALTVYKDFAHSPSKLKATTEAVREQFSKRKLIACMELHTFSSLNETFLAGYAGSMEKATKAFVYFNPHTVEHKKLVPITPDQVKRAFGGSNVEVYTDLSTLLRDLKTENWDNSNLLMMSSGNFDGLKFEELPGLLNLK